jgi:hypothetical protein
MEIFGIPVALIVIVVIWVCSNYAEKQQKEKKEIAKKWDAIVIGMGVEDVFERLGKPNRVVEMGAQEAWGYGPNSSDGEIMFVEGEIVGFQKPSCTLNVSVGQSSETVTANPSGEQSSDSDSADVSDGQSSNTNIMSINIEFYAPNGLHDLDKTIISYFDSLGYRIKVQQPPVLEFTRGSQWSCFYRSDIRSYYTDVIVRIGNKTEQGTRITVDFEVFTWKAATTKADAEVLEAEGSGLENRLKYCTEFVQVK